MLVSRQSGQMTQEYSTRHVWRSCSHVQALSASVTEDELSAANTAVALVGKGTPFTILEGKDLEPYLATLKAEEDTAPGKGQVAQCQPCSRSMLCRYCPMQCCSDPPQTYDPECGEGVSAKGRHSRKGWRRTW